MLTGKPGSDAMVDQSLKIFRASLNKIENVFLKDTPFLYSDTMTIADFLGVSELNTPRLGLCIDLEHAKYPKLHDWVERVRETVGTELYDEAHKFITIAGQSYKSKGLPIPKLE